MEIDFCFRTWALYGFHYAIVALKKGAQLLQYTQRGKPKFCPFRLSTDERILIWYSGKDEKHLRLDSITKIIPGTVNFQRQPEPGKECQSFSIVYENGERSLDLICKDKAQAESWLVGLRDLVSRSHIHKPFSSLRGWRGAKSCINSPLSYSRRKHNLGLSEDPTKFSQVRSLCGSPPQLNAERFLSDGLSCSSDSFYSSATETFSRIQSVRNVDTPRLPFLESEDSKKLREVPVVSEFQQVFPDETCLVNPGLPVVGKTGVLRDVLMWGEGIEGGKLRGGDIISAPNDTQFDALFPRLLDSIAALDVENISLGGKHAALVTRQGEVFCWGEENGGRLGHKVNIDLGYPKFVDALNGVQVKSVSCGEYQTCAVTGDGDLYTWGGSGFAAGLGDSRNNCQWLPHKVFGLFSDIKVSNVACGEWHIAVASSSGQLFTYGDGTFGVLGHGNVQSMSHPKEVELLKGLKVKSVSCGSWHTAAVVDIMVDCSSGSTSSGKLFTWGDGDKGKLGHVDREKILVPTCVARLVDHDFIQVSCGRALTVGLTSTGTVCTMGSAVHGQLGNPQAQDRSIAFVEGGLKGAFVKHISSGSYHVAALTSRGTVFTWGKGANGRLGLGDTEDKHSPALVEALTDRRVEAVACGSSFTAAICLHKSIFPTDQSGCSGCKLLFGFTRKKHNCYNCGFLFCSTCSSKKVMNASLAPNKSKPSRVCDACFTKLTNCTVLNTPRKSGEPYSKPPLKQNTFSNLRIDKPDAFRSFGGLISPRVSNQEESKFLGGRNQQTVDHISDSSSRPRWGQVGCPMMFSTSYFSDYSLSEQHIHPGPKYTSSPLSWVEGFSEPDKMLTDEVQRLQLEAKSLEKQCQMNSERLQQYQERIEETWSFARDEAAKCKAAKEIIKALTVRLYALSEKQSSIKDANAIINPTERLDMFLPQITPISTYTSSLDDVDSMLFTGRILSEVAVPKHRQATDICASPPPSHDTISNTNARESGPEQNNTKGMKSEWVEQDEPGVYITFISLPNGQKGLKRVRFSRKRFTDKEAERWWEENQYKVHEKYNIEGVVGQNRNKIRS
ncbi:hypothetical protein ACHQM5_005281 [Ranunculus cassubicifolius]